MTAGTNNRWEQSVRISPPVHDHKSPPTFCWAGPSCTAQLIQTVKSTLFSISDREHGTMTIPPWSQLVWSSAILRIVSSSYQYRHRLSCDCRSRLINTGIDTSGGDSSIYSTHGADVLMPASPVIKPIPHRLLSEDSGTHRPLAPLRPARPVIPRELSSVEAFWAKRSVWMVVLSGRSGR